MRILFVAKPDSHHFAAPYLRYLDHYKCIASRAQKVMKEIPTADVIWIEWANSLAAELVRSKRLAAFTMVRVHDWEIRSGRILDVNWRNVDVAWFINPQAREDFRSMVPTFPVDRQIFLPNAVDLKEWPLCAEGEKHLGIVTANVQPRKRLDRAIELMRLLPDDYRLTIRTSPDPHHMDPQGVTNLMKLAATVPGERITFEWRPFEVANILDRRDMIEFWSDKSHALSVAGHEGFCYGLAEGMACGAAGACLEWEWGRPRTFYSCVRPTLEELAAYIVRTDPGPQWRTQIEPYAAPALAYKLTDTLTRMMEAP